MGLKFLASPVLLALVFDLLTPLSFLSHPKKPQLPPYHLFYLWKENPLALPLLSVLRNNGKNDQTPHFLYCKSHIPGMLSVPGKGTLPEKINRPPHSCIFSLHFFMEKAELSEFRCPVLPRLCK